MLLEAKLKGYTLSSYSQGCYQAQVHSGQMVLMVVMREAGWLPSG
jgi:hypothetical protein